MIFCRQAESYSGHSRHDEEGCFEWPDLELQVQPGLEMGPAVVELYMT